MNISERDLAAQYERASRDWPFFRDIERRHGLLPFQLFATGSKETNLRRAFTEGQLHDDGHGHGLFGRDDRWHEIPEGFDTDPAMQCELTARHLAGNFRQWGSWEEAIDRYGPAGGRPHYRIDVLERRAWLEEHYGGPMSAADIIRAAMSDLEAQGVGVQWIDGWEDRGRSVLRPQGVVCHHTATKAYDRDYPSLGIVRDGRSDLPGPLSQFGLGRHSGDVIVIAAGTANHAGPGGWGGLSGNSTVWGIEAENDGIGEEWQPHVLRNYVLLCAALARHTGFGSDMVCGHREWSDYKIDPTGIDMDWFRSQVQLALEGNPLSEENELNADQHAMLETAAAKADFAANWCESLNKNLFEPLGDGDGLTGIKRFVRVIKALDKPKKPAST